MESFTDILNSFFLRKDSIFCLLLVVGAAVVVLGEALWRVRRSSGTSGTEIEKLPADDARLEFLWTIVPVFVLICLTSVPLAKARRTSTVGEKRPAKMERETRSLEPAAYRLPPR